MKDANILSVTSRQPVLFASLSAIVNSEIFSLVFFINLSVKSTYKDALSFCSCCEYLIIHEMHISKDLRNQQVFELRFDPFDEIITVTNQVISKVTRKSPLYFIAYKGWTRLRENEEEKIFKWFLKALFLKYFLFFWLENDTDSCLMHYQS